MSKRSGTTRSVGNTQTAASNTTNSLTGIGWERNWNPVAISGWSKSAMGNVVTPLKSEFGTMSLPLLRGLRENNPEYSNISTGSYDGRMTLNGTTSEKNARDFVKDVQSARTAQKELDTFLKGKEITPKVRNEAREIVRKWEKKIGKKLWV